jgi:LacI family transcriptional regulator
VSLLERLMRGTTDGAILMLPEESAEELRLLQRQGFPFVVVDPREPPPDGIACVAAMHAAGAKQATEHLLSLGHRRIGAIAGSPGWYATEERLLGFRAALAGAGILLDPELIVYSDWRTPRGTKAAEQLLSLPEPPTAIFGFNDNVAIGVLHAARQRGLSVPDDLSVVGFDDTAQASIVTPQLTSVRQPLAEMGRMGVSLLTRIIDGQRVDALRMELSTKLVVRDSTAPARPAAARARRTRTRFAISSRTAPFPRARATRRSSTPGASPRLRPARGGRRTRRATRARSTPEPAASSC